MSKSPKRVAVTGSCGQIAYSLLFRIASGELFGSNQPIELCLLDILDRKECLEGIVLELKDCAFPLLKNIKIASTPEKVFEGADLVLLIGARPRKAGMERKDLLLDNGKIFVQQAKALNRGAKNARILMVGNPCNTNCLLALHHAPNLPREHFFALTRLDQNRAKSQLAEKAGVCPSEVSRLAVWGNHSTTQVPDFFNAQIQGQPVLDVIKDRVWLEGTCLSVLQKRGAEVIRLRGASSAGSAAQAILDAVKSVFESTPKDDWFSMGLYSQGNPYGIDPDLVFSFPCQSRGMGDAKIVSGISLCDWMREKLAITEKELLEERDAVAHLFRGGA